MEHDIKKKAFLFLSDNFVNCDHQDGKQEHIGHGGEKGEKTPDLGGLHFSIVLQAVEI